MQCDRICLVAHPHELLIVSKPTVLTLAREHVSCSRVSGAITVWPTASYQATSSRFHFLFLYSLLKVKSFTTCIALEPQACFGDGDTQNAGAFSTASVQLAGWRLHNSMRSCDAF